MPEKGKWFVGFCSNAAVNFAQDIPRAAHYGRRTMDLAEARSLPSLVRTMTNRRIPPSCGGDLVVRREARNERHAAFADRAMQRTSNDLRQHEEPFEKAARLPVVAVLPPAIRLRRRCRCYTLPPHYKATAGKTTCARSTTGRLQGGVALSLPTALQGRRSPIGVAWKVVLHRDARFAETVYRLLLRGRRFSLEPTRRAPWVLIRYGDEAVVDGVAMRVCEPG